jgi:hypothetical protein
LLFSLRVLADGALDTLELFPAHIIQRLSSFGS